MRGKAAQVELFKIADTAFKDTHIKVTDAVFIQIFSDAFAVTHLAVHPAVGRGDTFYSPHAAVGVERADHGGTAEPVAILGSYLAVFTHLFKLGKRSDNLALAVGYGHGVYLAYPARRKQWTFYRCDADTHERGDMAGNIVICERGRTGS